MKRDKGFTLIEIVVVIGIIGILAAMAMPVFRTWQYRAYGTEATIMAKQILDAQITYFLENDKYYPDFAPFAIQINHSDAPDDVDVLTIKANLNILVPTGHLLDYTFATDNNPGSEMFFLTITSTSGFDIVKGSPLVTYTLDRNGKIENTTP